MGFNDEKYLQLKRLSTHKRRICFKCGLEKFIEDFYQHAGMHDKHLGKYKECTKKDTRQNYRIHIEHYIKYEKNRFQFPARKKYLAKLQRAYRVKYPDKYYTHTFTSNAIRDKRIIRQPCEICGYPKAEAHHENYKKPLEITWLCRVCHLQRHGLESHKPSTNMP